MSVSNISQIERSLAQFIQKMNSIGLTPLVEVNDEFALIAFSMKEFLTAMKKTLIKSGVPEEKLTIEVVPFQNDRYIKVLVKKR